MFFISVTKDQISQNFQHFHVEEQKSGLFITTIITDNLLSYFSEEPNKLSVYESPLLQYQHNEELIFSKIEMNTNKKTLTIFKPTISGRPIYYHINSNGEFFCSSHIGLLRKAGVKIEENNEVLPEFFLFRFVIPPNTLYKNVYQLLVGTRVHLRLYNEKWTISKIDGYIPPEPTIQDSIETVDDKTYKILNETINALSPCKDRISNLLSGGLDSSILFKLSQINFGANVAFSTSFPFSSDFKNLEKEYSQSAANLFNADFRFFDFKEEDYLLSLIEGISKAEIPVHHIQTIMIFLLTKKIPQTKNIVLSGLGADDVFGTSIHDALFGIERNLLLKILSKNPFFQIIQYVSHKRKEYQTFIKSLDFFNRSSLPFSDSNNLLWSIGRYGCEHWVSSFFNVPVEKMIKNRKQVLQQYENRSIFDLLSILYFYGSATMSQSIWSKLGEDNKIIFYYPYSNTDLINYVFSVPWNIKLQSHKYILSSIARKMNIPENIITRPKSSFGIQPKIWAEQGGVFEPLVSIASKVIDIHQIRSLQSSNSHKAMTYWNIINYSIWKRVCINNEPIGVLQDELQI